MMLILQYGPLFSGGGQEHVLTSLQTLSSIIGTAYNSDDNVDTDQSLVLFSDPSDSAFRCYTLDSFTRVPVDKTFKSPFIGWDIDRIAVFLRENATDTVIDSSLFLVADEQTASDQTLLLVNVERDDVYYQKKQGKMAMTKVRLVPEFANSCPVAITIGCMGANELESEADEDGVYRGGSWR
ncbi:hypothetical protein VTO42DRAFT_5491 [Malbranchea cinnamomea]